MPIMRLFTSREDRSADLRQRAENVFARIRLLAPRAALAGTPLRGQHTQRQGGPGHDFWQYRDFQTGDHFRAIDWRQTAKTDRLLIRQKEKETQKRISIWLQNDESMQFRGTRNKESKYQSGSIVALVAAMLGRARHDPVSMAGIGSVSLDDLTHIIDEATFSPDPNDLGGHEIFLIGDFLNSDHFFASIPHHKTVHLIQILDPDEIDLPFRGRSLFEHPSGHDREEVLNVAHIREGYKARLNAHIDDIRSYCRSRLWSYNFLRSGDDPSDMMVDLLLHGEDVS